MGRCYFQIRSIKWKSIFPIMRTQKHNWYVEVTLSATKLASTRMCLQDYVYLEPKTGFTRELEFSHLYIYAITNIKEFGVSLDLNLVITFALSLDQGIHTYRAKASASYQNGWLTTTVGGGKDQIAIAVSDHNVHLLMPTCFGGLGHQNWIWWNWGQVVSIEYYCHLLYWLIIARLDRHWNSSS